MTVRATASFAAFRQQLDDIASRADDLRPVMEDIGEDVRLLIDEGFRTEGASYGKRWQPLAPAYARRRQAKGKGTSILEVRSGRGGVLRKSMTKGGRGSIFDTTRDSVTVGTRLGIAPIHHRGGTAKVRKGGNKGKKFRIPARPMLPPARKLRNRYGDTLAGWVARGDRRAGL